MGAFEDYLRERIEERYQAYLDANSCPSCRVAMGLLDDRETTICLLCGHRSTFTRPDVRADGFWHVAPDPNPMPRFRLFHGWRK